MPNDCTPFSMRRVRRSLASEVRFKHCSRNEADTRMGRDRYLSSASHMLYVAVKFGLPLTQQCYSPLFSSWRCYQGKDVSNLKPLSFTSRASLAPRTSTHGVLHNLCLNCLQLACPRGEHSAMQMNALSSSIRMGFLQ